MSEDECEPCTAAAVVKTANMICEDLKKLEVDCEGLFEDVTTGRKSVRGYLSRVMDLARGTQLEESMDEVLKIYQSKTG